MPLSRTKSRQIHYANFGVMGGAVILLICFLTFSLRPAPRSLKALQLEIQQLQEKLISAQIITDRMKNVQELLVKNLAYSRKDSLAQGASLSFLKDLTQVLDKLKIKLTSLEPEKIVRKSARVEIPYQMDVVCNYHQLTQLINKMEKSSRLISIKEFEVENLFGEYFSDKKIALDQCQVSLLIHTHALLKE